jgi:hypothetical protein
MCVRQLTYPIPLFAIDVVMAGIQLALVYYRAGEIVHILALFSRIGPCRVWQHVYGEREINFPLHFLGGRKGMLEPL